MTATVRDVVFGAPSGTPVSLVMFAAALLMGTVAVNGVVFRSGTGVHSLVMAGGFALAGVAESLPAERRRLVGLCRLSAYLSFVGLLVLTIVAPGIVLGPL